MNTPSTEVLVSLLKGSVSVDQVATEHGLSVDEVERLKLAFLDGLQVGRAQPPRRYGLKTFITALVVGVVGLGAKQALSGSCATPTLFTSLGLNYFCADEPALAAELNTNTQQLATLVAAKVGPLGPADGGNGNVASTSIATTTLTATNSTLTTANATTLTANTANVSFFTPPYATWTGMGTGVGAGGAAIVNDNGIYDALMLVGNTASPTAAGRRAVVVFDDLKVSGRLLVGDKQCRTFDTGCQTSGSLEYFDRHVTSCGQDEMMKGFQVQNCGSTVKVVMTCCKL